MFAIERMSMDGSPPSWLAWFAIALPVSATCLLMCWWLILGVYQPWRSVSKVRPLKPNTDLKPKPLTPNSKLRPSMTP